MVYRVLRVSAWFILTVFFFHVARSDDALPANDPDAERAPPEDIVFTLKGKGASSLGSGYLWRMANRVHLAWTAQKPAADEKDQWFDFEFHLHSDGSVSDLKIGDAKLDSNGKKAIRAFLEATPFEPWTAAIRKNLQDRTHLRISIWLKAKKPNQSPEPTSGLRPAAAHL